MPSGEPAVNIVGKKQCEHDGDPDSQKKYSAADSRRRIKEHQAGVDRADGIDDLNIFIFLDPCSNIPEENDEKENVFLRNQILAEQQKEENTDDSCDNAVFNALMRFPDVDLRQRKDRDADPHRFFQVKDKTDDPG